MGARGGGRSGGGGLTPWRGLIDSVPMATGRPCAPPFCTRRGHLLATCPISPPSSTNGLQPSGRQAGTLCGAEELARGGCGTVVPAPPSRRAHLWAPGKARPRPAPARGGPDGSRQVLRRRPRLQFLRLQRRRVPSLNIHLGPSYSEPTQWSDAPACQAVLFAQETVQ